MKKLLISIVTGICALWLMTSSAFAFTVTLAWDANTEPDLAGYRVYVSQTSGDYGDTFYDVPLDGYSGFDVPDIFSDGVIHYFVVTALDWEGLESGYSNEVYTNGTTTDGPPGSPGGCYIVAVTP